MRALQRYAALFCVSAAVWSAGRIHAQITANPSPAPIVKRGLAVEIRDVVRLPDSRGTRPLDQDVSPAGWARCGRSRASTCPCPRALPTTNPNPCVTTA